MRKLVVLSLFAFLLSCRQLPLLLVLLDPYSAELLAAQGLEAASLRRELAQGFRVRVQLLDPLAGGEAERLIRAAGPEWVFLSPLLQVDAEALAAGLPDVRFLRELPAAPRAPNLRRLRFQRLEAFRDAGTIAARLLTRPALQPALGEVPEHPASALPKAGLLQAVPTAQGALEAEAFRTAFLAEAGPELLLERTIGSASDTGQARRAIESMREQGVALFLLKTYGLTGFCLELLRSGGGVAILEHGAGRGAFPEQVVLWLEEDLPGALRQLPADPPGEIPGRVLLRSGAPLAALPARGELRFPELFE
jgi:hypothetical protein